jgi:uncharacterized protein YgbK (DUF1537 family)
MFGAIADDVTGGTDLASVLRRRGRQVVQTIGLPHAILPATDAVVVSLKTRTIRAEQAVASASEAADALRRMGATQIFFKYCSTFDSTDEGNIGPVTDRLVEQLEAPFTIAGPAYPGLGRTVYAGHLFVNGQLLSESSMRHHPLTPMTDANLVRVLARQSRSRVGLVGLADIEAGVAATTRQFEKLAATGVRVAIVDAVFDRHLETIAEAAADFRLVTGGAALGGAWAARRPASAPPLDASTFPADGRAAILSGSCSSATLTQVARVLGHVAAWRLDPLSLIEDAAEIGRVLDWARESSRRGPILVYSTAASDAVSAAHARVGRSPAAGIVESAFGDIARMLASDGVRTFVVAGGETAGAVLQALGVRALMFGDEIDAGVPWTSSLDPEGFRLALKSGNFGGPDFFLRALAGSRQAMMNAERT